MKCMANEFIENGKVVKITTAFNMNQDFKEFSKTRNEELLNKYLSPEILFVDDLGTEPKYEDITLEYTFFIINERKMRNLKTVITSNKCPEELMQIYDERIFSRLTDKSTSFIFELSGEDRRLKINKSK